jgi:hypothetical protein
MIPQIASYGEGMAAPQGQEQDVVAFMISRRKVLIVD